MTKREQYTSTRNRLAVLALFLLCFLGAKAQTPDRSGTYYIPNNRETGSQPDGTTVNGIFYLCPSTSLYGADEPFVTTYITNKNPNSIWKIEYVSTVENVDYYHIHHMQSDKYLKTNDPVHSNTDRARVHLEAATQQDLDNDTDGDFLFFFANESSGVLNICPKTLSNRPNGASLNPAKGNKNSYAGLNQGNPGYYTGWDGNRIYFGGIVGVYDYVDNDGVSKWRLESASPATPTITNNYDGTITLACDTVTATIYYTTDGSDPTWINPGIGNTTQTYDGNPFTLPSTTTVIKAIAYKLYNGESQMAIYNVPQYSEPTIIFNSTTFLVTIDAGIGGTAYYTTDGSTPSTSSTTYSAPFTITSATTVRAIAVHAGYLVSDVASLSIAQVATPTIQDNGSNAVSITCATEGATIYYTTDGSTPTTSSSEYTEPLTEGVSGVLIKAIAVKENMINSEVGSGTVTLRCANPVIQRSGDGFTVTCAFPASGVTIYYTYTTDGSTPPDPTTSSSSIASGGTVSCTLPAKVKAFAIATGYNNSEIVSADVLDNLNGSGTSDDPYLIPSQDYVSVFIETVNTPSEANKYYKVTATTPLDFSGAAEITQPFSGTFDGSLQTLTGLTHHALFNTVNGGTVKNVILDNVNINSGTNVGAICNEATGASRIYNCGVLATNSTVTRDEDGYTKITSCSSTISGSGYVGGIVGLLDDESRVVNCFSYANITGGNYVGGIVGYNNVATTSSNLKTMVMNCMFYGDITGGTSKAPIYNGEIITNNEVSGEVNVGVSNFNYFWSGASYVQDKHIDKEKYNCALAAETRFLQRFEFFRQLLNSHRELAAWWATGDRDNKDEMMKWVMEPTQIGTSTPYPILKTPGKYPSVVNIDADHAVSGKPRNQGGKLGTLTVNIEMGNGAVFNHPGTGENEAKITTQQLTLNITDKDTTHFNFNYYKVQLPYYNDVGSKNYTGNRVVTGWKIVGISGGTPGTFSTSSEDVTFSGGEITETPYNFADRHCTNKDLYSVSGRVFNQGAYWDVPEGVTAITIQPYWAKAAYVADANADVVYNTDMDTKTDVPNVGGGTIYSNNTSYDIAGSSQIVYTSISSALGSSAFNPNTNYTVNDYAIVLVGNYHQYGGINTSKPYTVTSIDLDHDNEPDYTFMLRFDGRTQFHAVKYDFVSLIGLGMAQKSTGGKGSYNLGIPRPINWFEVTNTALFRITQMEYERSNRAAKPIILHGGVMEQWVSAQNDGNGNLTTYFHVGSNVWFKEFHLGCHQDKSDIATKHPPVSVTGGDFDAFYLTGLYATTINYDDDAECYINGGRFGTMAGTGMEGIGDASTHANGNITWIIDNADIKEFFAGGINAAKIAEGNLYTRISNSHVGHFYGGPKFGDMNDDRTVKTKADNCTFGFFFGAGYGGNSYYTAAPGNFTNDNDPWYNTDEKPYNFDWDKWVKGQIKPTLNNGNYSNGVTYTGYHRDYIAAFGGVSTAIDYQFLSHSNNQRNVGRLFLKFVKFSLATTHSVTSTLTGCTIENTFYGGGSLGKVEGDVESTLDGCTVKGDVFGAGYSATIPTVPVMDRGGFKAHEEGQAYPYYQPYYDKNLGVYLPGKFPNTVDYTWKYDLDNYPVNTTATAVDTINHILYTTVNLNKRELGSVKGNVTLTVKGNSTVFGSVFGGGEESLVVKPENTNKGNTEVQILGNTKVLGNIYGGGNMGEVEGNTKVIVNGRSSGSNTSTDPSSGPTGD